jgi:two-component system response regulator CpxR
VTPVEPSSSRKSILLIEDDTELTLLMTDYFGQHGFDVEAVHDGRTGLARALEGAFDLILLDVMLPVLDGFELLRQLRKRVATPVIMLTARTSQDDRIAGLNSGADDYLPKPFGPEELLARIRAVLRRTGHTDTAPPQIIETGDLRLNPATREVWLQNELVEITSIEFDILEVLARSAGRTVTRDELTAVLYQRAHQPPAQEARTR